MNVLRILTVTTLLAAPVVAAGAPAVYTGVITDTMCGTDHRPMKVSPDAACVKACAGHDAMYALADGRHVYRLSDQEMPATFAGKRVRVTGVLYTKTNVLKVDRIEPAE